MKNLAIDSHRESDALQSRAIQGLYSFKDCCQSYWTLRAKVELSIFQESQKGESKT